MYKPTSYPPHSHWLPLWQWFYHSLSTYFMKKWLYLSSYVYTCTMVCSDTMEYQQKLSQYTQGYPGRVCMDHKILCTLGYMVYMDHKILCTLGYMVVVSLKPTIHPYRSSSFIDKQVRILMVVVSKCVMHNHALNASHKRQRQVHLAKVHDCIDWSKSVYCYSVSTVVNVVCIVQATCTMNIKYQVCIGPSCSCMHSLGYKSNTPLISMVQLLHVQPLTVCTVAKLQYLKYHACVMCTLVFSIWPLKSINLHMQFNDGPRNSRITVLLPPLLAYIEYLTEELLAWKIASLHVYEVLMFCIEYMQE